MRRKSGTAGSLVVLLVATVLGFADCARLLEKFLRTSLQ